MPGASLPDSSASPADSPARTVEYSYLQGTAYDRDQHKLWITSEPLTQHFRYHDYTDAQHINLYAGLAMPGGRTMPYEPSRPYVPALGLRDAVLALIRGLSSVQPWIERRSFIPVMVSSG